MMKSIGAVVNMMDMRMCSMCCRWRAHFFNMLSV